MSMKKAYEQKLQAQLDEWSAEIDKLKAKAKSAEADAQLGYQKQIKELQSKKETAARKLTELKNASSDTWEELKAGLDDAWNSLADAVKSAASKIK